MHGSLNLDTLTDVEIKPENCLCGVKKYGLPAAGAAAIVATIGVILA